MITTCAFKWFVFALALLLSLGGCERARGPTQPTFSGVDITGTDYGKALALVDHTGVPRTLADFKGKVVLIFFGFTHCPDVCPTTMTEMAQTMKLLGEEATRVQVLFVTVDPQRDTQEVLAKYVPSFHPTFLGLRGDETATKAAAQSFHVFYEKRPGKSADSYSMDHFAGTFAFDPQGRLRLLFNNLAADNIAQDVKALLAQGGA